jgi:anti-sigma regulatory factor (Ser/Thr protein kinase)
MRTERSLVLAASLGAIREGRLFARQVTLDWGLNDLIDDVQLGVSELITNAVVHAGTEVELTLRLGEELTIEVFDADPELRHPSSPAPAGPGEALATSGRGLHIVAAVSDDWGVKSVPAGKIVWFTLQLPDQGRSDADLFTLQDRRHHHDADRASESSGSDGAREMQARRVI